jgi:hypothetical protein
MVTLMLALQLLPGLLRAAFGSKRLLMCAKVKSWWWGPVCDSSVIGQASNSRDSMYGMLLVLWLDRVICL